MASRYWGDEKHPDAIYAVYLRKVRYVPPQGYEGVPRYRAIDPDRPKTENTEMSSADHLEWESVKEKMIKAGTVERLVECLVGSDDMMDSRHFNVFFATYRAFTDSAIVLDCLLRRYEALENEVNGSTSALLVQNSIRQIVMCWLETYPEDFYDPDKDFIMLSSLLDFGGRNKLTELRAKARKQREVFKRIYDEGGMQAALPSLGQYVADMGFDPSDYPNNIKERVKMFDVGKENCVQIAEQLTFWDAALFKELLIHQCQGCVWSKRRTAGERVYTVKATIEQFNSVSQRVMTSIVLPDCRPEYRAKIISKWIDIARELRALKNFSSLKAVLSSLQSEPVHRLKSAWNFVQNRSISQFRELSSIYETDEDGDQGNARKILEKEGTAKSSPLRRPQLIQNCRRTKSDVNLAECQGTVPYLGNFLTDLAMVDESTPDYTPENLINFEKRRKEFEVLAKLRLFQSAARAYNIPMDRMFCAWFFFLPCLDENECFNRSLEIEKPPVHSTPDLSSSRLNSSLLSNGSSGTPPVKNSTLSRLFNSSRTSEDSGSHNGSNGHNGTWHQHSNSYSSSTNSHIPSITTGSSLNISDNGTAKHSQDSGLQCEDWIDGRLDGGPPGPVPLSGTSTIPRGGSEFTPSSLFPYSHSRSKSGESSLQEVNTSISTRVSVDNTSGTQSLSRSATPIRTRLAEVFDSKVFSHQKKGSDASSCSSSSSLSANGSSPPQNSFYLARVGLDDDLQNTDGANYKCIKIENGDRMPQLIARALEKHLIDDEKNKYLLVQLLPRGGEFVLPDNCNPFYAMAPDPTSPMLNLMLRKRDCNGTIEGGVSPQLGPSAKKLNRMKRTNLLRWSSGYL
ncbi:hypothetical protein L3Y34_011582 [Caenorhabditis briggsae]|uniref:Protein CBR-RGL-1 n=2 Tax=Caenorhabditis briggsae TaxID=6238 RepID=A0AAE8ZT63_CAEBR|nr:hypothetical protein L3Y34_011582 [Caenorhabditis briggsae]